MPRPVRSWTNSEGGRFGIRPIADVESSSSFSAMLYTLPSESDLRMAANPLRATNSYHCHSAKPTTLPLATTVTSAHGHVQHVEFALLVLLAEYLSDPVYHAAPGLPHVVTILIGGRPVVGIVEDAPSVAVVVERVGEQRVCRLLGRDSAGVDVDLL